MHNTRSLLAITLISLLSIALLSGQTNVPIDDNSKVESQAADIARSQPAAKDKPQPTPPVKSKHKFNPSGKTSTRSRPIQNVEVELTDARITFDHTDYDFGSVPPGSRIVHVFPLKNTGPDTLYITKIKAG
jgi:hypothetical protein